MNGRTAALAGVTLVLVAAACGGQGGDSARDEQRRYVVDICEPFADYFEGAIEAGFPEFQRVTTLDDLQPLLLDLRAVSQTTLEEFSGIEPPPDVRDVHEQVLAVLETEIAGYERVEAVLRSGDQELLVQALNEAVLAGFAGIGPTGFFPSNVPRGYKEAWDKECAPRLRQIPGVEG